MGQLFAKDGDDSARLSPRKKSDDDELDKKSRLKAARKSQLKRFNKFETQITIMNDFKASREKGAGIAKNQNAASEKPSLATELYLRSLKDKQIPLNMFEVSVDSPRGRKRYEYDRAKLEKRDFVNFILADVHEPEEDAERMEATGTNAGHGVSDNKQSHHSGNLNPSPLHRDSFANIQRGGEPDHRRKKSPRHAIATLNNFGVEEDSQEEEDVGDNIEYEEGMQEPDLYGNENFTQKLEEHNNLEMQQNRQMADGTPVSFSPSYPRKDGGFATRVQILQKGRNSGNKEGITPHKTSHHINLNEDELDSPQQSPEVKERQKQMNALEMNLDPETRAKLRIIQAIHGENFDKNVHMKQLKEKKKIIIESDDENGTNNSVEEKHPEIGGKAIGGAAKGKDRGGFVRDSSAIFDSGQNSDGGSPKNLKIQNRSPEQAKTGSERQSPGRRDPIIKLAEGDEEDEDRRQAGGKTMKNASPLKKVPSNLRASNGTLKNISSSRFSNL